MASGSFEKTSLDWQIRQLQQQFSEWLTRLFAGSSDAPTDPFQLPNWLLESLFWLIVIGLVSFLGWLLYRLLRPYLSTLPWSKRDSTSFSPQADRRTDWLQRSRTAQQQGDYREACRALYMATLQQLNDRQLIDAAASRTDGEYLRLLPTLDRPQLYQVLIQTHERLCFSDAAISSEQFDRCLQAFQQLNQEPAP